MSCWRTKCNALSSSRVKSKPKYMPILLSKTDENGWLDRALLETLVCKNNNLPIVVMIWVVKR